jgi:MFS family permease
MTRRQLYSLFLCSLVIWTVGNGLVPLLPVHATQLGARPAVAGYYLAFSYAALAIGAVAAGWISDRLDRRKTPLVAAGVVGVPSAWLMGRVGNVWAFSVLTAVLWFCGGLALALVGILTGLSAGEGERGKVLGMISLTTGLGALIGGLATGFTADRWGFPTVFAVVALLVILWPVAGLVLTEQRVKRAQEGDASGRQRSLLGKTTTFCSWHT